MAELIEKYNTTLMSNANVRKLVSSVCQDPQNETVDFDGSVEPVLNVQKNIDDDGQARREIIGWLNHVFFTNKRYILSSHFWFEMHTQIQKLLVVSMILEGQNLRSFGCVPEKSGIPQCLVHLPRTLAVMQENLIPKMRIDFTEKVNQLDKNYVQLYLGKE